MILLVQAEIVVKVPDFSGSLDLRVIQMRHLLLEIPVKVLTLKTLPESLSFPHTSKLTNIDLSPVSCFAQPVIIEFCIVIHPYCGYSLVVIFR